MEDGAWRMDKCIDSIRSIKDRIKSCISCNEDQCPFIKERLEQHLISHRPSTSRSLSSQQIKFLRKSSGVVIPSTNDVTVKNATTSTTELKNYIEDITDYKEALRNIIYDWSNDLQVTNEIAENIKQNMLNELLQNLYDLASEINNKDYDHKLNNEIDNFLDPLSIQIGSRSKMDALKENVIDNIHELNSRTEKFKLNNEINRGKYNTRDSSANTFSSISEIKKLRVGQNCNLNTGDAMFNTPGHQITSRNKQRDMISVGIQVQNSITDYNISSCESTFENKLTNNEIKTKDDGKVYKQKILKWLSELNNENYLNIDDENIKCVAENLFNRLKHFFDIKHYTVNDKLLLRGEIINFLLENMNVTKSNENIARLNRLANDLALDLLVEKNNNTMIYNTLYDLDKSEEINYENAESRMYYEEIFYDIVDNSLDKYNIYYSDYLIDEIIVCLLENYHSMKINNDIELENKLFTILKRSTGLSDYNIADITINIIENVKKIAVKNNNSKRSGDKSKIISIYNSEYDLSERFNHFDNSIIIRKTKMKNKAGDRDYVTEIILIITSWIHTLPVESRISEESKELFVNNLANDILDQVKLGHLGLNIDKDEYIYFSTFRWLNRFQYFENIDEAKPFVEKLIEKLKDIPQSITNIEINNGIINHNNEKDVNNKLGDERLYLNVYMKNSENAIVKDAYKINNKLKHGNLKPTLPKITEEMKLSYINIISDWLKYLPLDENVYKIDKQVLDQLINELADKVSNKDLKSLSDKECFIYLVSVVNQFMEKLPVKNDCRKNLYYVIDDLVLKLIRITHGTPCANKASAINSTDLNLIDFVSASNESKSDEIDKHKLQLEESLKRIDLINANFTGKLTINNQQNNTSTSQGDAAMRSDIELRDKNKISSVRKIFYLQPIDHLETQNSFDLGVPQLLYRLEQVNAIEKQSDENGIETSVNTPSNKYRHACCSKMLEKHQKIRDLGADIVNIIETWCNNLPIETNDESTNKKVKENVATKLYQKLGELNMNPKYFNDSVLYRELFAEEIECQLDAVPQNQKLRSTKSDLKMQLLEDITKKRKEITEKASGVKYKNDLEKTIDSSMPYPVLTYQEDTPGFKIYKDRLASLFILENFDHGVDAVKLNYEKRIRHDIDKYFKDVQIRNSIPLTTDQIFNELYSALYNIPHPNETFIAEEVEIIKTKCEIESWFESLPLRDAISEEDLLERDQILAMLARRLHEMEKYDQDSDSKMHKEIVKWLLRLPILPGYESNVDDFAKDLQSKLKATIQSRKCVSRNKMKATNENEGNLGTSQIAGTSNMPICCRRPISKRPIDFILESVEKWCEQLPLAANTPQEKDKVRIIKDNLAVKIIMKISELSINPSTIDDDFLYDALLDDAVDNLLSSLPKCRELIESKDIRKNQLLDAIKSVKPLMKEEKARYEYKREIKNTVNHVLKVPLNNSSDKSVILNTLTEEIADNFIIFNYYKDDEEESRIKSKVYNTIETIFSLVKEDDNMENPSNPLIKGNQLLHELSKIPAPGEKAIIQEVQEIEMKLKVSKFFKDYPFTNDVDKLKQVNKVKATLVKILGDYEKNGNTIENYLKTKTEVIKCLKKIDEDIDIQKVDSFIKALKDTDSNRNTVQSYDDSISQEQRHSLGKKDELVFGTNFETSNKNNIDDKWLSLLPVNPKDQEGNNFQTIPEVEKIHQTKDESRSNKNNIDDNWVSLLPVASEDRVDNNFQTFPEVEKIRQTKEESSGNKNNTDDKWLSLLPVTQEDQVDNNFQTFSEVEKFHQTNDESRAKKNYTDQSYKSFERGPLLSSSIGKDQPIQALDTTDNKYNNYDKNGGSSPRKDQTTQKQILGTGKDHQFKIDDLRKNDTENMDNGNKNKPVSDDLNLNQADHRHPLIKQDTTTQQSETPSQTAHIPTEPRYPYHEKRPCPLISQHMPVIRRPCRRPSLTIFCPSYLEPEACDSRKLQRKSKHQVFDENDQCSCVSAEQPSQSWCPVHQQHYCRCCNRRNPLQCGTHRYPHFYRY